MNWKGILAAFLCLFAFNANTYSIEFELDSMKYATSLCPIPSPELAIIVSITVGI